MQPFYMYIANYHHVFRAPNKLIHDSSLDHSIPVRAHLLSIQAKVLWFPEFGIQPKNLRALASMTYPSVWLASPTIK